jgi:hypothetical protein
LITLDVEEQIAELESEIDARQRVEKVFTGNETNPKIQILLERLSSLVKEKQDLTEKVIYRLLRREITIYSGYIPNCTASV